MNFKINKVLVETVVCAGAPGKGARFLRMVETRQAYKRRQEGCLGAWIGESIEGQGMILVQSVFVDRQAWKKISDEVIKVLDGWTCNLCNYENEKEIKKCDLCLKRRPAVW